MAWGKTSLTARQGDYLLNLAKGKTLRETAREFGIKPSTVSTQLRRAAKFLGAVDSRGALVAAAFKQGILSWHGDILLISRGGRAEC